MVRKTGRLCWGSICWSDMALASLGERDQKQNNATKKTNTHSGGGGRGIVREDGRSVGTFGLWISLVGPPSSFPSSFGFPSGLSIPSADTPPAPAAQMEVCSSSEWNGIFTSLLRPQRSNCGPSTKYGLQCHYIWAGGNIGAGTHVLLILLLLLKFKFRRQQKQNRPTCLLIHIF